MFPRMMVFDWSGDGGRILSEIDQVLDVHRWRLFPCMMAIRAVERVSRCSRNGFCSDSCVRKVWNTLVVLILVVLVIPQAIGLSFTRCAHSGQISLSDFPSGMECGMSSDSGCMQHFCFKVSVFSAGDTGSQPLLLPFVAILLPEPVLLCHEIPGIGTEGPSMEESPPGRISHTLFPFRN